MNADNEHVVREYFDRVWEQADAAAVDELLAEDFVDHDAPPGFGGDRTSNRQLATFMLATMRDKHHRILTMLSDEDLVAVRHVTEWEQAGDFFGVPADGKRLSMKGLDIYRVREGRIAESWHCEDVAGVMRQAGAPPSS